MIEFGGYISAGLGPCELRSTRMRVSQPAVARTSSRKRAAAYGVESTKSSSWARSISTLRRITRTDSPLASKRYWPTQEALELSFAGGRS